MFIAQSGEPYNKDVPRKQDVQIAVKGEYHARLYDTQRGDILPVCHETHDGKTTLYAALYDCDSLLLRFDQEES